MTRFLTASLALAVSLVAVPTISQACGGGYGAPQRVQHEDNDVIRAVAGEHLTSQNLRAIGIPIAYVGLGSTGADQFQFSVTAWSGSLREGHGERHVLTMQKRRGDWHVTGTASLEVVEGLSRAHVLNAERQRVYEAVSASLAANARQPRRIEHFEINSNGRRAVMVVQLANSETSRRFTLFKRGAGFRVVRQVNA